MNCAAGEGKRGQERMPAQVGDRVTVHFPTRVPCPTSTPRSVPLLGEGNPGLGEKVPATRSVERGW